MRSKIIRLSNYVVSNIILIILFSQYKSTIIISGTLITIASVILFGFIGCIVIVMLFFGAILTAGYFGFLRIYDIFETNTSQQRSAITCFLRQERLNQETNARDEST